MAPEKAGAPVGERPPGPGRARTDSRCDMCSASYQACDRARRSTPGDRTVTRSNFAAIACIARILAARCYRLLSGFVLIIRLEDVLNVRLRLGIRRDAVMFLDGFGTCIVRCDRVGQITVEFVKQRA